MKYTVQELTSGTPPNAIQATVPEPPPLPPPPPSQVQTQSVAGPTELSPLPPIAPDTSMEPTFFAGPVAPSGRSRSRPRAGGSGRATCSVTFPRARSNGTSRAKCCSIAWCGSPVYWTAQSFRKADEGGVLRKRRSASRARIRHSVGPACEVNVATAFWPGFARKSRLTRASDHPTGHEE